jgi:antitoxin component YwqK of YwqJK toxin-antitoxin module
MKRVIELSGKIFRKAPPEGMPSAKGQDAKPQGLNGSFFRFIIFAVLLIMIGEGCKPRTRRSETEKAIPQAVMVKMMEKAQREFYLSQLVGEPLEQLRGALKELEQTTGEVEYKDSFFGKDIAVTMNVEKGLIRTLSAEYPNGVNAMIYHSVHNGTVLDSTVRFYPAGMLYSRRINTVDSTKSLYEEFYQNGKIRSRNRNGVLYTWFDSGILSGMYAFEGRQVGQRRIWHRNGKLREISSWVNDTMNGPYHEWDSTGHLIRDMVFIKGKDAPRK